MPQNVKFFPPKRVKTRLVFFAPKRVETRRFLETVKQEQQQQQKKKSFLRPLHFVTRGQKSELFILYSRYVIGSKYRRKPITGTFYIITLWI